ncbi:diaminobutyrate--2-oxoglutarate transaminase, partial [Streptomyces sp. SID10244]|nr:diaminobutyrate--2-oxoglutarate transaminase [Streptomyces sp. SID10244]
AKGEQINTAFTELAERYEGISTRGRGMVRGLVFEESATASKVCASAFGAGLLAETSGPSDEVVKLLPALTISTEDLGR